MAPVVLMPLFFCRREDSASESNSRILAVAWLTIPWGLIASFIVYNIVMWWQGIHFSQDYARSISVLGTISNPFI